MSLELAWQQRIGSGFFGGAGFILQRVIGSGLVFLDLSGEVVTKRLSPGERLYVHAGHVGVHEPTVSFDIQMVPGFRNILFGGEGLVPRLPDRSGRGPPAVDADPQPGRGGGALPAGRRGTRWQCRRRAWPPPVWWAASSEACSAATTDLASFDLLRGYARNISRRRSVSHVASHCGKMG